MSDKTRHEPSPGRAWVVLGLDGHFEHASPAALKLLGRSLVELRATSPRLVMAMSDAESEALSEAWKRPGARTLAGEATIVRPGGSRLRVRFLLTKARSGSYRVVFERLSAPAVATFVVYTLPEVLAAWRAAERRLAEAAVGSAEWSELSAEIARFRDHYRTLVMEKTRALTDIAAPDHLVETEQHWT